MKNNDNEEAAAAAYLNNIIDLTNVTEVSKNENNTKERPKIGKQVRTFFDEQINGKKINQEIIEKFRTLEYSKDILGIRYPLLDDKREGDLTKRYWSKPIEINGKEYYICSQWYASYQEKFDKWKPEIIKEISD